MDQTRVSFLLDKSEKLEQFQRHLVNNAVEELERAGAPGITGVEIHPAGYGCEPDYFGFQYEEAFKRYAHHCVVKLEVVCIDHDWERLATVIEDTCRAGGKVEELAGC